MTKCWPCWRRRKAGTRSASNGPSSCAGGPPSCWPKSSRVEKTRNVRRKREKTFWAEKTEEKRNSGRGWGAKVKMGNPLKNIEIWRKSWLIFSVFTFYWFLAVNFEFLKITLPLPFQPSLSGRMRWTWIWADSAPTSSSWASTSSRWPSKLTAGSSTTPRAMPDSGKRRKKYPNQTNNQFIRNLLFSASFLNYSRIVAPLPYS